MAAPPSTCPVFAKGFAAIEAEFVVQLAKDAPANVTEWTAETARRFVKAMYIGIEIASSPLVNINDYGPAVVASDFGNNAGLLLGAEVPDWQTRSSRVAELRNPHRRRMSSAAATPPRSAVARWPRSPSPCAAMRGAAGRCAPATSSPPAPPPVSTPSQQDNRPRPFSPASAACDAVTVPMTPVAQTADC